MKKILLIEDEALIQKSLKKLLEKRGAKVDSASSGRKAISLIIKNDYDRIICDLMLQDTTGFDVIEAAKSKYSNKLISEIFIIITAYSSGQTLEKAANYNCKVIFKPFDPISVAIDTFLQ